MSWSGSTASTFGRLKGTEAAIWQLTAIDIASSYAWAQLVICKGGNPIAAQTSKLAQRVAIELKASGWQLERFLSDNGNEFKGAFTITVETLKVRHTRIHAGRPQTNGHVEALHKTILHECWRPAFARYLYPRYTGLNLAQPLTNPVHNSGTTSLWCVVSSAREESLLRCQEE